MGRRASSYKGSIHDDQSNTVSNSNDSATGSKVVLGNLSDNSRNQNNNQTKNSTKDNYGIVHNQADTELWFWLAISGWVFAVIGWILPSFEEIIRILRGKK